MLLRWSGIWRESLIRTGKSSMFDYMFFIPETVECKGWTTCLPQSPTWKCKEHCKSWNEPKDRAKVTPCLSETMQVNKSRSMRKWWRCQAACSNCVHCTLGRFTKRKFWNFEKCPIFYCYMDQYKDMLENKFCSNIAPSASTGPPHFTM